MNDLLPTENEEPDEGPSPSLSLKKRLLQVINPNLIRNPNITNYLLELSPETQQALLEELKNLKHTHNVEHLLSPKIRNCETPILNEHAVIKNDYLLQQGGSILMKVINLIHAIEIILTANAELAGTSAQI